MPERQAIESIDFQQRIRLATCDFGRADVDVRPPYLLDAAGIDGRVRGVARSHPGFKALGWATCYNGQGPLIVGPGVDHTTVVGQTATLAWRHWPLILNRNTGAAQTSVLAYFKALAFRRGAASSRLISGFVVTLRYEGPTASGVVWETGLPTTVSSHGYVVAFVYWDDSPYVHPHPAVSTDSVAAGWRVRILSKTSYKSPTTGLDVDVADVGGTPNQDVAGWGTCGYIVNPDVSGVDLSYWGSPSRLDVTLVGDGGTGPQVLYYDEAYGYVRMRPMGSNFSLFTLWGIVVGSVDEEQLGFLDCSDGSQVACAVTLRNPTTGRQSNMVRVVGTAPVGVFPAAWCWAYVQVPVEAWSRGYTRLRAWRSVVDGLGALYLEHEFTLPATCPAYDIAYDGGSDLGWRRFHIFFGAYTDVIAGYEGHGVPPVDAGWSAVRTLLAIGFSDEDLLLQEADSGSYNFDQPPPSDSTRIVAKDEMTMVVSGKVESGGNLTYSYGVVPARLRWSSPYMPRPEDYSALSNLWPPDDNIGMVHGMEWNGDFIFVVGTAGTLGLRRVGDRIVGGMLGDDLVPVNGRAWCVGGGRLFILTRKGLFVVSAAETTIAPIDEVSWITTALDAWGPELTYDGWLRFPYSGLAYDEAGDCLYIWNAVRAEALCVWLSTGAVTRLYDFPWRFSTQGAVASSVVLGTTVVGVGARKRAYFCMETGVETRVVANYVTYAHPLDVFYADFERDVPDADNNYAMGPASTMHGVALGMADSTVLSTESLEAYLLKGVTGASSLVDVDNMTTLSYTLPLRSLGTTFALFAMTAPELNFVGVEDTGLLDCLGTSHVSCAVTLYNSTSGLQSNRLCASAAAGAAAANTWGFALLSIPVTAWSSGYTKVRVWRSVVDAVSVLYLEHEFTLPALPAYDAAWDGGGGDVGIRKFQVFFGAKSADPTQYEGHGSVTNYPDARQLLAVGYTDANLISQAVGSATEDMVLLARRRMMGAYVHLIDTAETLHLRRMLYWLDMPEPDVIRMFLYPVLTAAQQTLFELGGEWWLAPVVFAVKTAPLYLQPDSFMGIVTVIKSLAAAGDVVCARQYYSDAGAEAGWRALVTDVANSRMWAFGESSIDDANTVTSVLLLPYQRTRTTGLVPEGAASVTSGACKGVIGRFREVARERFPIARKEKDTCTGLAFKGPNVCVGVDALLSGVVYDLRALRVAGSVYPSL